MNSAQEVAIREAVPDDAESLALLHVEVWEDAYGSLLPVSIFESRRATMRERIEGWHQRLTNSPGRTIVASEAHDFVGFASVGPPREDDVNVDDELWALYVRASRWGAGIGHALLVDAIADRPACLWVLRGNNRATAFYRKHGFAEDGKARSDEYGSELRMVRPV